MLVKSSREKEYRWFKFYAKFKGVDLDADSRAEEDDRVEAIKKRVEARMAGKSEEEIESDEWSEFGGDFEVS